MQTTLKTWALGAIAGGVILAGHPAAAAEALMSPKTEEAMRTVLARESDSQQVRAATALGAARAKDSKTVEQLLKAITDESPEVRAAACYALGRGRTAPAGQALRGRIADESWIVRIEALRGLAELPPSADNTVAASKALGDADDTVRQAAYQTLAAAGDAAAVQKAVAASYPKETDAGLRAMALEALAARCPSVTDTKPVMDGLADADGGVRAAAARAAGACQVAAARDKVLALLKDKEPHVRAAAAGAVTGVGGNVAQAAGPLVTDPDSTVRGAAAAALGSGSVAALPALRTVIGDAYRPNRRIAAQSAAAVAKAHPEARAMVLDEAKALCASGAQADRIEGMYLIGTLADEPSAREALRAVKAYFREPAKKDAKAAAKGAEAALSTRDATYADLSMALWMVAQSGAREEGSFVVSQLNSPDVAVRLQAAAAVGLLKTAEAVPVAKDLLGRVRTEMNMKFFEYAGEPRTALVRSLDQLGTPEALAIVDQRFDQLNPFEDEDTLTVACDSAMRRKAEGTLLGMRKLSRAKDVSAGILRLLIKAEKAIAGAATIPAPPDDDPAWSTFFIQVKEK